MSCYKVQEDLLDGEIETLHSGSLRLIPTTMIDLEKVPSRQLTYPTLGKVKSPSTLHLRGIRKLKIDPKCSMGWNVFLHVPFHVAFLDPNVGK